MSLRLHIRLVRLLLAGLITTLLLGCATLMNRHLNELYGPADPSRFDHPMAQSTPAPDWQDVKPILDSRCVACHACYDAPCQLKLGAYQGLTRGGNKDQVYDSLRLFQARPTRLFTDAQTHADWRQRGFHPVLNERSQSREANREGSVLYQMLALKDDQSWPEDSSVLPASRYDFRIDRDQQCVAVEDFDRFREEHPEWGMPYGMPPLAAHESATLMKWLEAGAPAASPVRPLSSALQSRITTWETFLNGNSLKERLMSRYLYEHWFLAHLYFDDQPAGTFLEIVRSKTPPGQPITIIATRLPYDDPGEQDFFYRLRPVNETIVAKTHMPYALSSRRMAQLRQWFLETDAAVDHLPSHEPQQAANPFRTFEQLSLEGRYRFLLDEAQYIVMTFIKGPVCRGQVAVAVIQDHIWAVFVDPSYLKVSGNVLTSMLKNLPLPTAADSIYQPLSSWFAYSQAQTNYLRATTDFFNRVYRGKGAPSLDLIWKGDDRNDNAALTIFRHFDSASVVKGLIGEAPETVWVIGYPLLERIYYLLVAGYDVYGNTAHSVHARLYMDFLRMEGELHFLGLLPRDQRDGVRDFWYRGASADVKAFLNGNKAHYDQETGIHYRTRQPYPELLGLLKQRLAPTMSPRWALESSHLPISSLQILRQLESIRGRGLSLMPEAAFLTVRDAHSTPHHFTLLRRSAHSNVAGLFNEDERRLPNEDQLLIVNGFIGAYPNALYDVSLDELPAFTRAVRRLSTEADYTLLANRYAVRRTSPHFWSHLDALNAAYRAAFPLEAGLFDLNRLENR